LCVFQALFSGSVFGQEAGTRKKAPQLTTDDVKSPLGPSTSVAPTSGPSEVADNGEWSRYSPGNSSFSLELPGPPRPLALPKGESGTRQSPNTTHYFYSGKGWTVFIAHVSYPGKPATMSDVANTAAGFLDTFERTPGVTDPKFEVQTSPEPRISMRGRYKQNGIPLLLEGFVTARGNDLWVLSAAHAEANKTAVAPAHRAVTSASLD